MKTISENVTEQIIEKKSKFICDLIYVNSIEEVEKIKFLTTRHHAQNIMMQSITPLHLDFKTKME